MNRLFKDSFIYLFGQIIAQIPPFLLMPYLTRKLGASGYGEMAYYTAFLTLFGIVVGMCQDGAVARYYYFYGKRNLNNLVVSGYIYAFFISGVIFIVALFNSSIIFMLLATISFVNALLAVQLALRQCQKEPFEYIKIQIFGSVLVTILTILILEKASENLVIYRFFAIFLGSFITAIFAYTMFRKKGFKLKLSKKIFKSNLIYIFSFGLPLVLHHLSGFTKGQFDRIFIYQFFSSKELGIYAAGFMLASIFSMVINSANKAIIPYFFENLKNKKLNKYLVIKIAFVCFILFFVPALLVSFVPNSVFILFLGDEFDGVKYFALMFLIGIGFIPAYLVLVNYLFFYSKNSIISVCSVISTVIYLIILFIASKFGIKFVPFAMIVSNLAILPLLYYQVRICKERN
ncbi:oligosaccharide flippase family protein [Campylobacter sp. FMV-PI01]|uniref:Oligosaccharide flippase family protein n=1 Tax=Campylobacter portucalensis TaxID=2608384 RepID=A0A6L5WFA0_9BACT|nr:oligosaccharide flippase family protein [Campylobacter portucalensis]MSN95604.1 oligosaccharide flippase family protein [Campylobacter portucalensis]